METKVNFSDIIKKSVVNSDMFSQASFLDTTIVMMFAFLIGVLIFFVYRKTFRGVVYNNSFAMSLAIQVMLTALVILTISSNIVLSLGMVGALSIVRFRTAIKDPMDLVFLFWSICSGIAIGAKGYFIVLMGCVFIIFSFWFFNRFQNFNLVYIIIIHYTGESAENEVIQALRKRKYVIKSRIQRDDKIELTIEITMNNESTALVGALAQIVGVTDISLIQYNGDYNG